jgi:hypothetical protein
LLACSQLLNNRNVDLLLLSGIFLLAEGILNLCCTIYIAMEFHALDRLDAAKAEMETAAAPTAEKKKASTVQVTVRLRPEQHKQLKAAAFHRDCDMSELVRQALDQFFA